MTRVLILLFNSMLLKLNSSFIIISFIREKLGFYISLFALTANKNNDGELNVDYFSESSCLRLCLDASQINS